MGHDPISQLARAGNSTFQFSAFQTFSNIDLVISRYLVFLEVSGSAFMFIHIMIINYDMGSFQERKKEKSKNADI